MTVIVNLSEETEQVLRKKAAREGQNLDAYLQGLAERDARQDKSSPPLSGHVDSSPQTPEEWVSQLYAWAARQTPRAVDLDDRRETIYSGRGE
jgi:hypothetical protein